MDRVTDIFQLRLFHPGRNRIIFHKKNRYLFQSMHEGTRTDEANLSHQPCPIKGQQCKFGRDRVFCWQVSNDHRCPDDALMTGRTESEIFERSMSGPGFQACSNVTLRSSNTSDRSSRNPGSGARSRSPGYDAGKRPSLHYVFAGHGTPVFAIDQIGEDSLRPNFSFRNNHG